MPSTTERPKVWTDITDEELIEAVRFAQARTHHGVAGSAHVEQALSQPTQEQWPDGGPNAVHGLGLIPWFGPGSAPSGAVMRRLKKLVAAGRLRQHAMVRPRGKPAPPSFSVID